MTWTTNDQGKDIWTPGEDPIMPTNCPADPVRDAVTACGGPTATKRATGFSRTAVYRWLSAGRVQDSIACLTLASVSGVPAWRLAGLAADPTATK